MDPATAMTPLECMVRNGGTAFGAVLYPRLPTFSLVMACCERHLGIGYKGKLPWKLPEDLAFFRKLTSGHTIIMGRKTWDSLPRKPLPNRVNIVLTRQQLQLEGAAVVHSAVEALQTALLHPERRVFVIGGAEVYALFALGEVRERASHLYVTWVKACNGCDTRADFLEECVLYTGGRGVTRYFMHRIDTHDRVAYVSELHTPEAKTYRKLLGRVRCTGLPKSDRTGVGTVSLPGYSVKYDLSGGRVPFVTCKRLPWKSVIHELLWYIRGSTHVRDLHKVGIHYWDANSSRSFLDARGLQYEEGQLGPVYGWQWRHWGADFPSTDRGIDQLAEVIRLLREDPFSRRIILSAWNVADLPKMALPPCHCFVQFIVDSTMTLHCVLYQRSADVVLGVPFNIACYSVLVCMLCHLIPTLTPGSLTHCMGDAHIYKTHFTGVETLLERPPTGWPLLRIVGTVDSMDDFTIDNFILEQYHPWPAVKFDMAV